ncbi:MAG: hypothetical protein WCE21_01005 [Candidatus Babeliales bacterium]
MNTLIIYIRTINYAVAQAIALELLEHQLVLNAQIIGQEAEEAEAGYNIRCDTAELLLVCRMQAHHEPAIRITLARLYPYHTPVITMGEAYQKSTRIK